MFRCWQERALLSVDDYGKGVATVLSLNICAVVFDLFLSSE